MVYKGCRAAPAIDRANNAATTDDILGLEFFIMTISIDGFNVLIMEERIENII